MAPSQHSFLNLPDVRRKRLLKHIKRLLKAWHIAPWKAAIALIAFLSILCIWGLFGPNIQGRTVPLIMHHELWQSRKIAGAVGETDGEALWQAPPNPEGWGPCTQALEPYHRLTRGDLSQRANNSSGFLQVFLEGGLNQQRIGISNAVVVARILNAVLILPELDVNPVWKDDSTFGELFDVTHFVTSLSNDVHVVTSPPPELGWSNREFYATGIRPNRVKSAPLHASPKWYTEYVLPLLREYRIVAIAPFSHRLAFDGLDPSLQKLRCRVDFEALRFTAPIRKLGDALLERIRDAPKGNHYAPERDHNAQGGDHNARRGDHNAQEGGRDAPESGRFLALHLRFDEDMAAHSACYFGGGWRERRELRQYREYAWQGRVEKSQHSEEELRRSGKCPLTPEETGLFLAGLGFSSDTRIYLASHEVYGGEARLAPLRLLFPYVRDKFDLASAKELDWFKGHASRLAALDYHVLLQADVMMSAAAGNMHNVLGGHRVFDGVRTTINPDNVLLAELLGNASIGWSHFSELVQKGHRSRVGQVKRRKAGQSVYTYPAPDCMCVGIVKETYRTQQLGD